MTVSSETLSAHELAVVVIGAGPVGLAAAAHLHRRGERFLVVESGDEPGAAVREWAHVRMFSPWEYNVDPVSAALLRSNGWTAPRDTDYPTGGDLVTQYVAPLAAHPVIAPHLRYGTRVVGISRVGFDRTKTAGRESAPFAVRVSVADDEDELRARAVIDASGTWRTPNPLGAHGYPALGEGSLNEDLAYGMPDVLGRERARYADRRVLVVGSGHSAMNVLLDLAELAHDAPATRITWAVRRATINGSLFGGGDRDQLAERGRLGARFRTLVDSGQMEVVTGFGITRVTRTNAGIVVSNGERELRPVDLIVAATGFRPNLDVVRELRVDLDAVVESPRALAPLIDPNIHSCGTVPPHGAAELRHPEPNFYIVGMKSYGRAPTFLLRTGYEQVRSVVCALVGDEEGARRVELTLPETGVCSTDRTRSVLVLQDAGACCGPAAGPGSCC
jgi:thioredoxin reductase